MWPGLVNDGILNLQISCSLVAEDKTLCAPSQSQTKLGNLGVWAGALIPSPKAVGLECVNPPPLSSIPFLLSLQIPCSPVVAKQICNSCAPYPPPTRLREIQKRALGHRLLPCWAYVIGLRVNEKSTKYRGTYAHFFLRCGLDCCFFSAFFFSNFKPPPPSLPHMGFAVFLNIGLNEACIAIDVSPFHHM